MDSLVVFSLVGIVVLVFMIIATIYLSSDKQVQTKEQKRQQIISEYKRQLKVALEPLKADKQARLDKKSELLKKFSSELSMNIFFDKSEIRELIQELSKE